MPVTGPFEKYTSRYENWFEKNADIYRLELEALMSGLPRSERSLEIGVGTGRFADPPGIRYGMDPSPKMLEVARKRGIQAVYGVAEELPFKDLVLDLVLMVTTVCFLDDIRTSFKEVYRVLRPGGSFVIGFVDKDSSVGKAYQEKKMHSVFYRNATFYSVNEIVFLLRDQNFDHLQFSQTIIENLKDRGGPGSVMEGYGKGGFVVIRAKRSGSYQF